MKVLFASVVSSYVLAGAVVSAQPAPSSVSAVFEPFAMTELVEMQPAMPTIAAGTVDLLTVEPMDGGKPVKDAPYSAEAVTEVTQTLSDGNRIQRRTSAMLARDGQGRTRREQQAMALGGIVAESKATFVTITDPVGGFFITLHPEEKLATRAPMPKFDMAFEAGEPATVMSFRADPAASGAGAGIAVNALSATRLVAADDPSRIDADIESLGSQEFDGVRADGTRTTNTIPAGAIGNEQPIAMVTERWYSPELQAVVMSKRSDPRFGETVYRLTNIQRAEPDAALFKIPSDYRIEEPKFVPAQRVKPRGQ